MTPAPHTDAPTIANLLDIPITYDIVVSDFGRDAALEYVRLVSKNEKLLINRILQAEGRAFFDEYRRIMFTLLADVAFYKATAIAENRRKRGYLTQDILIGLGSSMTQDFIDRVATTVVFEALAALNRGHERLRILVPCNGLSVLAKALEQVIGSARELRRIIGAQNVELLRVEKLTMIDIKVHTVPEVVMHHLGKTTKTQGMQLLVLGTRGVNSLYESLVSCPRNK